MSDRYQDLIHTPIGKLLSQRLGLPNPVPLERYEAGQPVTTGAVLLGEASPGDLGKAAAAALDDLGVDYRRDVDEATRYKALVFDATGIGTAGQLSELQRFFTPVLRRLESNARIVVLGSIPDAIESVDAHIAQRALEGFTRSLAKEVGRGSTVQLVQVADKAGSALTSTLGFLLSPKSAYVSGQVIRVGATGTRKPAEDNAWLTPLVGKVALVTGASRGIGEQIARVLHRDGATVIGVDVPAAANELTTLMSELGGESILLDISRSEAPARLVHTLGQRGGVDVVVHNAGITRDRRLVNMKPDVFAAPVSINLIAPQLITEALLDNAVIRPNGRIIGVSSISGIAGNFGQTNYGASKAGVIGLVDALAPRLTDGITINAVAPGFIETKMTDAIPFMTREVGRRLNSLQQGGQPVDVAEAVAWFAHPASTAVNGNLVRVCGQGMLGA
jgi:3-oxoacyl-[acyl-carrier protein] reductase